MGQNLAITWGEGCVLGAFFRVMYHAAKGDGRVSIPPRSAFWGAFWGAWQRSRCLREGEEC